MKKIAMMIAVIAALISSAAATAMADVWVNGYVRGNGTYVAPYVRSNPDGVLWNNYSYGR